MNVMKSRWSRVCLGVFILTVFYLMTEPAYLPTAIPLPKAQLSMPRVLAHKGKLERSHYPGNTMGAIREVLASSVGGLEVDVRLSSDGVPFLFHSDRLEESTNGVGVPEDYSWVDLKKIHYLKSPTEHIVALEDLFKLVGSQKWMFLDIKSKSLANKRFATALHSLIRKYLLYETVVVESMNPMVLLSTRLVSRDIQTMMSFTFDSEALGEEKQTQFDQIPTILKIPFIQKQFRRILRPDYLGVRANIAPDKIDNWIAHGYPIVLWTLDSNEEAKKFYKMGVLSIQTNIPESMTSQFSPFSKQLTDAGGTSVSQQDVRYITNTQEVLDAITYAKINNKKISIGGRRHTMGGQTLFDGSIHLNMMGFNNVRYDKHSQEIVAEAGATWKQVQVMLDQFGRSVFIMQSDNIFTVGGSISVNVHGWQVKQPPISSSVVSMKIATMDGRVIEVSPDQNTDLFQAVIGGYGQFGIILEARLRTAPNTGLLMNSMFIPIDKLEIEYERNVSLSDSVELAYGRLDVSKENLFNEAGLFWFENVSEQSIQPLQSEKLIALKRSVFRQSQYSDVGKSVRWAAEKWYVNALKDTGQLSRNNAMNADIHVLWPLFGGTRDFLQEYFIPKSKLVEFLSDFRALVLEYDVNLLNVTIREVLKDDISKWPYAQQDVFALVCLYNTDESKSSNQLMQRFTRKLIDRLLVHEGTFYLPYRMHYTDEQLLKAYPSLRDWKTLKKQWDPENRLMSLFGQRILELNIPGI